jgi:predicted HTH domain antitoxin
MSDIQPGNDVSQSTPQELLGDPFEPLVSQLEQFEAGLQLIFDNPRGFFEEVVNDVLSRPPEERFTGSTEIIREHVRTEFGSTDVFRSQLPDLDQDRLLSFLERIVKKLRDDTLKGVFYEREADDYLILAGAHQWVLSGIREMRESDDDVDDEQILAIITALWARLYELIRSDQPSVDRETIRDIGRARYYLARATGDVPEKNPEKQDDDELYRDALELGAVVAYTHLNISVNRGAELVDLSQQAFIELLSKYDVQPRYGPQSPEKLYEDDV